MGQSAEPFWRSGSGAFAMYDACRVFARYVKWNGDQTWDFSRVHYDADIPPRFTSLLNDFLASVLKHSGPHKGWKIPETTLIYPWLVRMYPDMHYIFWIRNPRDCVLGRHMTDDMRDFGIQYPEVEDERLRRAISWKYQYDLVKSMPKPRHWIEVRFEDFVLKEGRDLAALGRISGNTSRARRHAQGHDQSLATRRWC